MAGSAVIIGGGLGGLVTGALLSRKGCRVTVLEKNRNVGGGLQTFRRGGAVFSPCMHLVGGRDGGAASALLRSLGVDFSLEPCAMSVDIAGGKYRIPAGRDSFTEYLSGRFPGCGTELRRYVGRIGEIHDGMLAGEYLPESDALLPADKFIAGYISDGTLRGLLAWLNPLTGAQAGVTPAYVHAVISSMYIDGAYRFAGGTAGIVRQLCGIIVSSGGEVRSGCAAVEILVGNGTGSAGGKTVAGVAASDGKVYAADAYVSDISPAAMAELCPEDAFPKAFRRRIAGQKPGISMFSLYIRLKDCGRTAAEFFIDGTDGAWKSCGEMLCVREGNAVTVMVPLAADGPSAMPYGGFSGLEERIFNRLEREEPGFRDRVDGCWSATPETLKKYLGDPAGSAYGFSICSDMPAYSRFGPRTRLRNFFLTGQNVFLHGLCGVSLASAAASSAVSDFLEI